jgi:hypothetical protein
VPCADRPGVTETSTSLAAASAVQTLLLLVAGAFLQERARTGATAPDDPREPPSITVLAFKGPPSDADGAVLAREVAADLVSELARSANLRVVSSQSSSSRGRQDPARGGSASACAVGTLSTGPCGAKARSCE